MIGGALVFLDLMRDSGNLWGVMYGSLSMGCFSWTGFSGAELVPRMAFCVAALSLTQAGAMGRETADVRFAQEEELGGIVLGMGKMPPHCNCLAPPAHCPAASPLSGRLFWEKGAKSLGSVPCRAVPALGSTFRFPAPQGFPRMTFLRALQSPRGAANAFCAFAPSFLPPFPCTPSVRL